MMNDMIPIDPRNLDPKDTLEFLQNYENDIPNIANQYDNNEMHPVIKFLNDMQLSPLEIRDILSFENREKLDELLGRFDYQVPQSLSLSELPRTLSERMVEQNEPDERFTLNYNTPDNFRNGWESRDTLLDEVEENFPESRVYSDEDDVNDNNNNNNNDDNSEYGSGQDLYTDQEFLTYKSEDLPDSQIFREINKEMKNGREQIQPAVYSEGGVVWSEPIDDLKETNQEEANPLLSLDKLLLNYNLGFKRPERLDVKKPGPPFDAQITDTSHKGKKQ